jgi:hypothetical protein
VTILMLKDNWYGTPAEMPNPLITIATDNAAQIEALLKARGNKLWFCSPTADS